MRKLFLTIFVLSIFIVANGQSKKDNTIIVHGFVPYNQIKSVLFDEGYTATTEDTAIITTNKKGVGTVAQVNYIIKRTDTTVVFKGFLSGTLMGTSFNDPLDNTWGNNRTGFETMKKMATSFGLPVSYLRIKQ